MATDDEFEKFEETLQIKAQVALGVSGYRVLAERIGRDAVKARDVELLSMDESIRFGYCRYHTDEICNRCHICVESARKEGYKECEAEFIENNSDTAEGNGINVIERAEQRGANARDAELLKEIRKLRVSDETNELVFWNDALEKVEKLFSPKPEEKKEVK